MQSNPHRALRAAAVALAAAGATLSAHSALVDVTISVQNLASPNGIAFAPLHVGFHSGSYDAFNLGQAPTAPIISVAEGGAGNAWRAAFAAADPMATLGTVGGLLLPGASNSLTLRVDTAVNPMFSFASMVVPSNDFFIGNDNPMAYRLFNAGGMLSIPTITVKAGDIWDAGSEVFDPAAAAFVGNNDLRTPQNSVVALNFAELASFNGLTTGAGYTFTSGLAVDSEVYRIGFAVSAVPEPETLALLVAGLLGIGFVARRRAADAVGASDPA